MHVILTQNTHTKEAMFIEQRELISIQVMISIQETLHKNKYNKVKELNCLW